MDKRLLRIALGGFVWGVLASSPVCAQNVNWIQDVGATTGNSPSITARGSDPNINILLTPLGTGQVGIGTAAPQSLLHVYGGEVQVGSSGATCTSANGGAIRYASTALSYCNGSNWVAGGSGAAAGSTGQVQFNGGAGAFAASSNLFWDNTNNRLGIGTSTAPVNKLDVYGGLAVGTSYAEVSTAPTNGAIIQGSVGIGTASPNANAALDLSANPRALALR